MLELGLELWPLQPLRSIVLRLQQNASGALAYFFKLKSLIHLTYSILNITSLLREIISRDSRNRNRILWNRYLFMELEPETWKCYIREFLILILWTFVYFCKSVVMLFCNSLKTVVYKYNNFCNVYLFSRQVYICMILITFKIIWAYSIKDKCHFPGNSHFWSIPGNEFRFHFHFLEWIP